MLTPIALRAQPRPASRPCTTCRSRRVKCDATRPVCQRCTRARRVCVYPPDFDLAHRDETARTQRRVTRNQGGAAANAANAAAAATRPVPAAATTSVTVRSTAVTAPATTLGPQNSLVSQVDLATALVRAAAAPPDDLVAFVAGAEVDAATAAAAATAAGSLAVARSRRVHWLHDAAVSESGSSLYARDAARKVASDAASASASSPPPLTSSPTLPVVQLALGYFAANFMLVARTPTAGGFYEYVVPVLRGQPADSAVQCALRACAFAALGNRWRSDSLDLHAVAVSQYTAALAQTTRLLNDARQRKTDATLATVLLLGLFENITDKRELVAWHSHVTGAVRLVESRGPRRVQTRTEQLLFNSVRLQLVGSDGGDGSAVDKVGDDSDEEKTTADTPLQLIHAITTDTPQAVNINWCLGESVIDSVAARCQRFALETGYLRVELARQIQSYAASSRRPRDASGFHAFLLRARAVDNEIATWMAAAPPNYQYRISSVVDPVVPGGDYGRARAFPGGCVHAYPDLSVGYLWNLVRTCRLVMSSFVVRCLALLAENEHDMAVAAAEAAGDPLAAAAAAAAPPPDYRLTPAYAAAVRRCNAIIADILASVPFFLDPPLVSASSSSASSASTLPPGARPVPLSRPLTGFACGRDDGEGSMPKALAGQLLIWPMTAAYTHDCTTPNQHAFLAGRLRHAGHVLGVRYAIACVRSTLRYPSMLVSRDRMVMAKAEAGRQETAKMKGSILHIKNPRDQVGQEPVVG